MRIFAAGIITETNSFSAIPTSIEDFRVERGRLLDDRPARYPDLDLRQGWGKQAEEIGAEFIFSLMAWAQPAGITTRAAYETLRDEILADLQAVLPVDIVLLNLHGAMMADGYDDCEGDIVRRVRALAGPAATIGVELDPHCHLNEATLADADVTVIYKEYPHTDINDRAEEVFALALATRRGTIRPTMALFDCRMIGLYPTSRAPMRDFVDAMTAAERSSEVLSMSLAHGFPFADLPEVGAKLLVVTDNDPEGAAVIAQRYGTRVHALRREIGFDAIAQPIDVALSRAIALAGGKAPVVVADQSDNPGGGAPGDATYALHWLHERQAQGVAMGILYDPEAVRIAHKAGVGATLALRLGGKLGPTSGTPIDLTVTITALACDYVHGLPQASGPPSLRSCGDMAALRAGGIDILVSSHRCQCMAPTVFSDLGIDPLARRIIVVKSAQHFHGAFGPISGEVIYMAAPGAVSPDPRLIPYVRLDTARLYPWNDAPFDGEHGAP